jgi:hypothetical protein
MTVERILLSLLPLPVLRELVVILFVVNVFLDVITLTAMVSKKKNPHAPNQDAPSRLVVKVLNTAIPTDARRMEVS